MKNWDALFIHKKDSHDFTPAAAGKAPLFREKRALFFLSSSSYEQLFTFFCVHLQCTRGFLPNFTHSFP